ncbi:MAG TPA: hypothetical protein VJ085_07575 [Candidatus Acidoferrales bacterium]|nr:hypothetical protein [Candidatus Acidoferrales bacterium]
MKPLAELFYDLAALALVAAFAYFFFWGFVVVVGASVVISVALMTVERLIS